MESEERLARNARMFLEVTLEAKAGETAAALTRETHRRLKRDRCVHGARHMDGLLTRPTVYLDGDVVMEEGKLSPRLG